MRGEGYSVHEIDAGPDVAAELERAAPDAVFNALHGRWGEDGCAQGLLEWMGIPYTHSGVLSSALAMDKIQSREVFKANGLPVAEGFHLDASELGDGHPMEPPYVVKPHNEGSSVGVQIVAGGDQAPERGHAEPGSRLVVERYIPGRELTVTVLGDSPLQVTDIITEGWYNYDSKYSEGGSRHVVPAEIPQSVFSLCMDYAFKAHQALGCRGISRADFRWDESLGDEGLFLLETNTQPGMTPTSLSPEQARACGIGMGELCRRLVEDASCSR